MGAGIVKICCEEVMKGYEPRSTKKLVTARLEKETKKKIRSLEILGKPLLYLGGGKKKKLLINTDFADKDWEDIKKMPEHSTLMKDFRRNT